MNVAERLIDRWSDFVWRLMPDWQKEYLASSRAQLQLDERSSKYSKITTALNFASTFNPIARFIPGRPLPGIAPGSWIAYHLCRSIDDIADGEQPLPQEYHSFRHFFHDLHQTIETENYPETEIGLLLRGTIRDMEQYHGVDIRQGLHDFIEAMYVEYERRANKAISTREELFVVYQQSFSVPQDIAFICFHSRIRSKDVPELAQLQGRLYAVKDLAEEIPKGIVFIPKEVIPDMDWQSLLRKYEDNPQILSWNAEELDAGKELIARLRSYRLDMGGKLVMSFLVKGIEKYIQQITSLPASYSNI
ncbi:MAG: hypothetical protein ABIJ21_04675 [Nanoarchaeota archaeon]